jgi:hypothetical protein
MITKTIGYGENGFSGREKKAKMCIKKTYNRGKNYTGGMKNGE